MLTGLDVTELPADAVEVGRVLDAWGIKGWIKVLPYSASAEALFSSKRWFLLPTETGARAFEGCLGASVKGVREHSDSVVAHIQSVDDRNASEALRGARIFVPRASFPLTATDEYYWVDLIGLEVVNREGQSMGRVKELMSTGPQTVLVLEYAHEGKAQERLIPFVSAYVDKVDLAMRSMVVDWQADY